MTLPATDQLEQTSPAELVALVKALMAEVARLQEENRQLREENEKLRRPPSTSRNSSQPPARDQKSNRPENKPKKKQGPPFGHLRHTRPLVDHPDRVIPIGVEQCRHCQSDLRRVAAETVMRRQVTELPQVRPLIIETQQAEVRCPHCQQLNRGSLPAGLEAGRSFGPRLEATVIYLKHQQHLSYERIVASVHEMFGLRLSEGGVAAILERAGKNAAPVAEEIKQEVIASTVVKSDETSARIDGRTWWQWVFIGAEAVYHTIVPRRNAAVIAKVLGEAQIGVWVCDCFGAQLKAPAKIFQLCLQHQLRDLQRVLDQTPQEAWAAAAQKLFREAIHLKNRFQGAESPLTLTGYLRRVTELENRLDALLEEELTDDAARKLQARFQLHREKLLVFLYYPEVPPTNNQSEQALRTSVIHRKVTNGFRSEWGAETYAALQSIIATAQLRGQKVFETLVNLMGPPVLHFADASSP